jgi:lipoprotein-releasing system permease protein
MLSGRPLWLSVAPLPLALPLNFLRRRTGTRLNRFFSVVTVITTFLSSIFLLLVLAGTNGAKIELRNKISGLDSHVLVRRARSDETICDVDAVSRRISALPGVSAVAPYVWVDVQLETAPGAVAPSRIKGIVPALEGRATDINEYISLHDVTKMLPDGGPELPILIGTKVASRLGVRPGQSITILKPGMTTRFYPGTVTGVFASGTRRDSEIAYTTLSGGQSIRGLDTACVNAIAVRTEDPMTSQTVARQISKRLGAEFYAADWSTLYPQFRDMIGLLERWILVLNSVLLAFSVMFSAGAVLLVIYQRRRELALLLTMGMKVGQVRLSVALVGTLIGLVGAAVAVSIDPALCGFMTSHRVVSLPESQANISYIPFIPRAIHLVLVGILQVSVPTLLGWWVSGDLKRIELVEVLRDE